MSRPGPCFLNVDLEVRGRKELLILAGILESQSSLLFAGKLGRKFVVRIEARPLQRLDSPERTLWALIRLVRALPPRARALWRRADARIFDIGFAGGSRGSCTHSPCETSLTPELLRAAAALDASIAITVYPPMRAVRRPRGTGARPRS